MLYCFNEFKEIQVKKKEKNYKHFIGYLYIGNKVKPLNTMLPKASAYLKTYDGLTKWMYFSIEDDDLF